MLKFKDEVDAINVIVERLISIRKTEKNNVDRWSMGLAINNLENAKNEIDYQCK